MDNTYLTISETEYFAVGYRKGHIKYFNERFELCSCELSECKIHICYYVSSSVYTEHGYTRKIEKVCSMQDIETLLNSLSKKTIWCDCVKLNSGKIIRNLHANWETYDHIYRSRRPVTIWCGYAEINELLSRSGCNYKVSDLSNPFNCSIPAAFKKCAMKIDDNSSPEDLYTAVQKYLLSSAHYDEFTRSFTIKQPRIERYIGNTNKNTFDIVRIYVSLTSTDRATQVECINTHKSRLIQEVLDKIEENKLYIRYGVPVNFLKLDKMTLTNDSQICMIFTLPEFPVDYK